MQVNECALYLLLSLSSLPLPSPLSSSSSSLFELHLLVYASE